MNGWSKRRHKKSLQRLVHQITTGKSCWWWTKWTKKLFEIKCFMSSILFIDEHSTLLATSRWLSGPGIVRLRIRWSSENHNWVDGPFCVVFAARWKPLRRLLPRNNATDGYLWRFLHSTHNETSMACQSEIPFVMPSPALFMFIGFSYGPSLDSAALSTMISQ